MDKIQRPDPDKLLTELQRQEEREHYGSLRIFFGACAGVGKTYNMLRAAQALRNQNQDVVIGLVETHQRRETEELLCGLEIIPPQSIPYHGKVFREFDLNATLVRKPSIVLVDEIAHSNIPGSRHAKRWQDVQELLHAGIKVYTTLNVQHLESLNNIVGHITGIHILETIPDKIFDTAEEVTLVDLPPDDLIQRLKAGKVYVPEQSKTAIANFFRKGNLIALRELALRRMADRIDLQMREYRTHEAIQPIWQTKERILACIGADYRSEHIIRKAYGLATHLHADWITVYVETPALQKLNQEKRKQILKNLKLAQDLGAETKILAGSSIKEMIVYYARTLNATKIVIGKSSRSKLSRFFRAPLAEQLTKQIADIDLYLASYELSTEERQRFYTTSDSLVFPDIAKPVRRGYLWAILICSFFTVLSKILAQYFYLSHIAMVFVLGVSLTAMLFGYGPSIFASTLSVLAFDFFFLSPKNSFLISHLSHWSSIIVMFFVTIAISHIISNLQYQARVAKHRERRTSAIYALSKELSTASTVPQIIEISARHLHGIFQTKVSVLLPDAEHKVQAQVGNINPNIIIPQYDLAIAQWVYDNHQPAGYGTETLSASTVLYLPLRAPIMIRGVLALLPLNPQTLLLPEQQRLLNNFVTQIALSLEHVHYLEMARNALLEIETQHSRNLLLKDISHKLQQPLLEVLELSKQLGVTKTLTKHARMTLACHIQEKIQNILDVYQK